MKDDINKELIAPCGMNCGICSAYLAYSHHIPKKKGKISHCIGCRPRNKQCAFLKKGCEILKNNKIDFCYKCRKFPCDNLKRIVKSYIRRYNYSVIDNLIFIKENGLDEFMLKEENQHRCTQCGDTICVHNKKCYSCDKLELIRD
jgi:hypothetical protein